MEDAIAMIQKRVIDLLGLVLQNSVLSFDREYFQQIFDIIMGTNVAPILANIFMAMLENELRSKCILDPKLEWLGLLKKIIDDGFGGFLMVQKKKSNIGLGNSIC